MKRYLDMYKRNNAAGISFNEKVAQKFLTAESLATNIVVAIDELDFEQRYHQSEKLIHIMTEIHDWFEDNKQQDLNNAMQRYCIQNIHILTRVNLKNDKQLAVTLKQSFREVATMWNSYVTP